ncbi:hypothetical protein TWF730_005241 [Orbilia blumenaviensis]|uniref:Uncharacterized protein n=1 Tax=Orbilia blumenaviensis TaxID=1796055 RepID=A0AAV9VK06_9PEZI
MDMEVPRDHSYSMFRQKTKTYCREVESGSIEDGTFLPINPYHLRRASGAYQFGNLVEKGRKSHNADRICVHEKIKD